MNIVQTKKSTALSIQEALDEEFSIFQDRISLHETEVPNWFVYISEYAWDAFLSHTKGVYARTGHEGQGIFLGKYFKDDSGRFVVATSYLEGEGESGHAYVGMSEQCLSTISKKCVTEDLLMVIWAHTHPNFGAFYSGTDVNCLKTNFFMPFQIGIVVDIIKQEIKGFRVNSNDVVEFEDYAIYNSEHQRLFHPYQARGTRSVNAKSIEIKKKEIVESDLALSSNILQEVKTISTVLSTLKDLLVDQPTQETDPQQVDILIKDIALLKDDLAHFNKANELDEASKIFERVQVSFNGRLEAIKVEIGLIRETLEKELNHSWELRSLVHEMKKQNKLQIISLVSILAIFFLVMFISLYGQVGRT